MFPDTTGLSVSQVFLTICILCEKHAETAEIGDLSKNHRIFFYKQIISNFLTFEINNVLFI